MEYRLANNFEVDVKKIDNGFIVQVNNPDEPRLPQTFFANELEAYEFAAQQIANVIEALKNEA